MVKFKSKDKVYFDCRHLDGSGIGTYITNLIKNYPSVAPDLHLELLAKHEHLKAIRDFTNYPVKTYNDKIYSVSEQVNWIRKIDLFSVLHVPHYNAPIFYPGKLIVTVHDVCHVAMKKFFPGVLKRVYSEQFLQQVLNKADQIITVSHFSKSEIIKYFKISPDKIHVIYNGVENKFRPVPSAQANDILKKHNLPDEYLLFLGNVKPHKNIMGLIQSYLMALIERKDLPPLVILGNHKQLNDNFPRLNEILSSESIRKQIIFTGYLPYEDIPAVYSKALLFLFPSFYEGFGLPVLEAMACGVPTITSNCSSLPEVSGEAARLVDPYDHEDISRSILEMAGDRKLREHYRKKGFEQVKKYSWANSASKHLELYKKTSKSSSEKKFAKRPFSLFKKTPQRRETPKSTTNILFLDQYGDRIGGGQRILLDIIHKFKDDPSWRVFVSVPDEGLFTDLLKKRGIDYWRVPTGEHSSDTNVLINLNQYTLSSLKSTYLLGKKIKENKIDVIYCNGGRTFLTGLFLSLRFSLKVFWHLHLIFDTNQKKMVTYFGKLPNVKAIFAVSQTLMDQYNEDVIYSKIKMVHNWVSPDLFHTPPITREKKFNEPLRIGVVGLISYVKGQWTVLESLSRSKRTLPIDLKFFGDVDDEESDYWRSFSQKAERMKKDGWSIRIEGFKLEATEIFDHLDVLIIPSLIAEAFGLTAIEAMSRGVIVLANRSGALKEIIKDKENGFLYDANRFDELLILLNSLTAGEYDLQKIRKTAEKGVFELYNPKTQLEKLHEIVSRECLPPLDQK
ncbi:MAG: glycosyltransferase [Deltaproteobacteria bacterium]|nr:glycosyltransferase [Deltaproteobacteria bacterium]